MNAEERARKILNLFLGYGVKGSDKSYYDEVLLEITEAFADGYLQGNANGFRTAQEKAAGIAEKRVVHNPEIEYDSGWNRGAQLITQEIRAMEDNSNG